MLTKEFKIQNQHGFHARPASLFCSTALKYKSDITVRAVNTNQVADGKSVLSILMLDIQMNCSMLVTINGEDEEQAMDELSKLLCNSFNE